jgi:quinolinate synthase
MHASPAGRRRLTEYQDLMQHRITVPEDVARRARRAIERMIAIGGQHPLSPVPQATVDPGE